MIAVAGSHCAVIVALTFTPISIAAVAGSQWANITSKLIFADIATVAGDACAMH